MDTPKLIEIQQEINDMNNIQTDMYNRQGKYKRNLRSRIYDWYILKIECKIMRYLGYTFHMRPRK